jgi:hypothetical protein
MKPIKPELRVNARFVEIAKSQPQYLTLPANIIGPYVETKWRLTLRERFLLFLTGYLYLTLKTFGQLPPIRCSVERQEQI